MAFFSEIFFSRLLGKPVYTVDERYYGEFRDFVVKPKDGSFVITKIRIRRPFGKRMILPWTDVQSIDTDPVLFKLKKKADEIISLEYGDDEFRLKRDMLDQQIIDTNEARVVRVNDLKIVAVKDEFFVVAADIGVRGILRRLGLENLFLSMGRIFRFPFPNKLLSSKFMDPYPARVRHDIKINVAHREIQKMHPADLADVIEQLDQVERMAILQGLDPKTLADTMAELDPKIFKHVIAKWEDERLLKMLEKLPPDEAADILSQMPYRRIRKILKIMKPEDKSQIRELLDFEKHTAGSLMNPEVPVFHPATVVKDAIEMLRQKSSESDMLFYVYIADEAQKLLGVISMRALLFADPQTTLGNLMKQKPITIRRGDSIDTIIKRLEKYDLVALPVVDRQKILKGFVTVDDVLHELETHHHRV